MKNDSLFHSQDPWRAVRCLIDAFNDNRKTSVVPGGHMVVDEVMSAWRGAEGKYSAEGCPHVTKIARKPEGVGAEMKALADGESNIMLRLDIMEGKDRQREKPLSVLSLHYVKS